MSDPLLAIELYAIVRQEMPSSFDEQGGIHWVHLEKLSFDPLIEWVKDAHIFTLYVRENIFFDPIFCDLGILPPRSALEQMLDMLTGDDLHA